ncbi:hypothetical protein FHR23_002912 [Stakelama sediminis]|uniref:Uncharacterized protein n=1 Tax=Stakelama sediminis TaxID=463200 RepID=A0A840Z234_9SPHN|nr:hypothetical protein [Stakelama sediminis]MBB5719953.1 hypothetical protein [Stakelama sediminis]
MEKTVFWSWQSDLDPRVTKDLVRYALDEAVKQLAADLEEADRTSVTSDTQGVAGTPDIVATILRKIDEAAVFVGDVTPIALSESGKACANPNVLLEMGYANKSLTETRVIQVWNAAFEGATVDRLPFDMRGRRGPLSFHLLPGSDTATLRAARDQLTNDLVGALRLALDTLPAPPPDAVHWQPHFQGDPDLWFDRTVPQTVTSPMHGSSRFRWMPHWPGYARIIPSKWSAKPDAKRTIADHGGHPALLANANGLNFGVSRGGAAVYWPRTADGERVYPTLAVTQWFEKTGEFWGVAGGFLFAGKNERLTLATGSFWKHWLHFLERNCALALAHGGALPIHVRLGVNGLAGSYWPGGPHQFDDEGHEAVEDAYEYDATLTSTAPEALKAVVVEAFNGLAAVYGVEAHSFEQIEERSRY